LGQETLFEGMHGTHGQNALCTVGKDAHVVCSARLLACWQEAYEPPEQRAVRGRERTQSELMQMCTWTRQFSGKVSTSKFFTVLRDGFPVLPSFAWVIGHRQGVYCVTSSLEVRAKLERWESTTNLYPTKVFELWKVDSFKMILSLLWLVPPVTVVIYSVNKR